MRSLLLMIHFGNEAFIKNELQYLDENFDKIYILYNDNRGKSNDVLEIPKNARIIYRNIPHRKIKKALLIFTIVFFPSFYKELWLLVKTKKITMKSLYFIMNFLMDAVLHRNYIEKIIRNNDDIKMIYTYWYTYETMAALFLKQRYNTICVTRTHGYDLYEFRNAWNHQPFKLWMDKRLDKIFFISQHGYDYYLEKFKTSGLDKYSIFRLGTKNRYAYIDRKQDGSDTLKIISCSYMVPVKRIHLIIEALAQIDEIPIYWVHIGDGLERGFLAALAEKLLKNKPNIYYNFTGFMENEQIMTFYDKNYFDCFVSASKSEGLPVSMMEAISFGIPIIATNVGGVSELVNENTGILMNEKVKATEIRAAILDFYYLPDEIKSLMSSNARKLWETSFNAEINYTGFSEELVHLLK